MRRGRSGRDRRGALRPPRPSTPKRRPGGRPGRDRWPGGRAEVVDTRKDGPGDLHAHRAHHAAGRLTVGAHVRLAVDAGRPRRTRLNHSAAHLAHAALKARAGSTCGPEGATGRRRPDALRLQPRRAAHGGRDRRIETEVNAVIRQNIARAHRARWPRRRRIEAGAVALFGEKYGDAVRVLTLGKGRATVPIRWSCAAAPTWRAPATSRSSRSSPSRASPLACAASRR